MSQKDKKRARNPNVFERNNDRYYESEDSEDEGSKRKEGQNKLDEM
jgi:hypothetical protein